MARSRNSRLNPAADWLVREEAGRPRPFPQPGAFVFPPALSLSRLRATAGTAPLRPSWDAAERRREICPDSGTCVQ